jgi:hypothetical protein
MRYREVHGEREILGLESHWDLEHVLPVGRSLRERRGSDGRARRLGRSRPTLRFTEISQMSPFGIPDGTPN